MRRVHLELVQETTKRTVNIHTNRKFKEEEEAEEEEKYLFTWEDEEDQW